MTSESAAELVVDAAGLVAIGAVDVQTSGFDHLLVLGLGGGFVSGDSGVPGGLRGFELLAGVVEADHAGTGDGRDGSFSSGDGAGLGLADEVLAGNELGVAAEENVGAAAGHVGGDRDHTGAAGLSDELGF